MSWVNHANMVTCLYLAYVQWRRDTRCVVRTHPARKIHVFCTWFLSYLGIPMGVGMVWIWGLKFNPHGYSSPENRRPGSKNDLTHPGRKFLATPLPICKLEPAARLLRIMSSTHHHHHHHHHPLLIADRTQPHKKLGYMYIQQKRVR